MKKISVIGIGKLGLCWALELEKNGYDVLGCDVNKNYVDSLNNKSFKSFEPNVNEYLLDSINFKATTDVLDTINFSDIIFVVVATPSLDNGKYDHQYLDNVINSVIKNSDNISKKNIVVCCTTMPGHCDKLTNSVNQYGHTISYNPEFIAQGSIINDMENPDMVLIGECDKEVGDVIEEINLNIAKNTPVVRRMKPLSAEITKLSLNCYVTMKIAFANNLGDLSTEVGAEPEKILEAVGSDSRIGNKYFKYGFGFGGPCFPRDNKAMGIFSDEIGLEMIFSKVTDEANNRHLNYQVNKSRKIGNSNVTVEPVSYKDGSTIITESQRLAYAVKLAETSDCTVTIRDNKEVIKQVKEIYGGLFNYEITK